MTYLYVIQQEVRGELGELYCRYNNLKYSTDFIKVGITEDYKERLTHNINQISKDDSYLGYKKRITVYEYENDKHVRHVEQLIKDKLKDRLLPPYLHPLDTKTGVYRNIASVVTQIQVICLVHNMRIVYDTAN